MTIKEAYEEIHADYEGILMRMHTDEKIMKYLIRFMHTNYDVIIQRALKEQDYDTAFLESHNLKGICSNLNISVLGRSSGDLAEALRSRKPEGDISPLIDAMQREYNTTMAVFKKLVE